MYAILLEEMIAFYVVIAVVITFTELIQYKAIFINLSPVK